MFYFHPLGISFSYESMMKHHVHFPFLSAGSCLDVLEHEDWSISAELCRFHVDYTGIRNESLLNNLPCKECRSDKVCDIYIKMMVAFL